MKVEKLAKYPDQIELDGNTFSVEAVYRQETTFFAVVKEKGGEPVVVAISPLTLSASKSLSIHAALQAAAEEGESIDFSVFKLLEGDVAGGIGGLAEAIGKATGLIPEDEQ